jgi:hypothetical protein
MIRIHLQQHAMDATIKNFTATDVAISNPAISILRYC